MVTSNVDGASSSPADGPACDKVAGGDDDDGGKQQCTGSQLSSEQPNDSDKGSSVTAPDAILPNDENDEGNGAGNSNQDDLVALIDEDDGNVVKVADNFETIIREDLRETSSRCSMSEGSFVIDDALIEKIAQNTSSKLGTKKFNASSSFTSAGTADSGRSAAECRYDDITQPAKIAAAQKNERMLGFLRRTNSWKGKHGEVGVGDCPFNNMATSLGGLSLDEDVARVDRILFKTAYYVIGLWLGLICFSYCIAPRDSIQWLTGTERNACLVELSILSTAVTMKHGPLLWEINLMDFTPSGRGTPKSGRRSYLISSSRASGILVGGLVVQFIAIMTVVIMVAFPVPVMIDPVLGSRVHLIRWCEWTPLAGFMTLMTECIDAPIYNGSRLTHDWKAKFFLAANESLSTLCGLFFPFCPNAFTWYVVMIISCVTYTVILFRYYQKKKAFEKLSRGSSVDEIELYDRSRMSLALHGMCCFIWTGITIMYFVSNAGHLVVPKSWSLFHDPAATMLEECFMDLVAKILYMALIIEAHYAAFDEAKRANRRLAELKNTMSVVWESSSDTIAISVRKISGSVTSMVSPSFFRPALVSTINRTAVDQISAIVLELQHSEVQKKRGSLTSSTRIMPQNLPHVALRIIEKADFAGVDLHNSSDIETFDGIVRNGDKLDPMGLRVLAFTDMLSRAWQSNCDELVFEHDAVLHDDGLPTKFEVKVTRLEENAVVVVVRDVSERYRRFEAEKRFVFETTARQKDAEANRFTRHEVKNGLLAAIEICGNIREQFSEDFNSLQKDDKLPTITEQSLSTRIEHVSELDRTLHEVLDIVLAETMARDVIHEMYVPRMQRVDVNYILSHMRGFKASSKQFSLKCSPSPMPILLTDQGLFKCIHGNAIRNAIKYGEKGGPIRTEATYNAETGWFEMHIINLPGPGHAQLVAMGDRASELVFSHSTRLHKDVDLGQNSHSAGDGAWIMHKCATILGGSVQINFEDDRTVFVFRAPCKVYDAATKESNHFHLPPGVWGIAIDDSKIQRKLLRRFFIHAGIQEHHQIILGQNSDEISTFVEFVVDFVQRHPNDLFFIIADENLELSDDMASHGTIFGSECIKRIRNTLQPDQEKRMLALVRSANDSQQDLEIYNTRAHGYMPKVPLQVMSVREMVAPLWTKRFPLVKADVEPNKGSDSEDDDITRIPSIENLRDLTLISPAELLSELEQIDSFCINSSERFDERWPALWDKLHQLKGDLKTVNVDDRFTRTIQAIESMRGGLTSAEFMSKWLVIRTDVIAFDSTK